MDTGLGKVRFARSAPFLLAACAGNRVMSELHWNTITPAMRTVWTGFARSELSKEFYLAGGTALALQLGHRFSVDLDFFSQTQDDIPALMEPLRHALKEFSPILSDSAWGNLVFL